MPRRIILGRSTPPRDFSIAIAALGDAGRAHLYMDRRTIAGKLSWKAFRKDNPTSNKPSRKKLIIPRNIARAADYERGYLRG